MPSDISAFLALKYLEYTETERNIFIKKIEKILFH